MRDGELWEWDVDQEDAGTFLCSTAILVQCYNTNEIVRSNRFLDYSVLQDEWAKIVNKDQRGYEDTKKFTLGYITSSGIFLSISEAAEFALKWNQVKPEYWDEVYTSKKVEPYQLLKPHQL